MSSRQGLNGYLRSLERRLRWNALSRGAALLAAVALATTVIVVFFANAWAFSDLSVGVSRVLLFLAVAAAFALGLLMPILRANRRAAARRAEQSFPEFEQRLLTFAEADKSAPDDPFLDLLADDAMQVARQAEPSFVFSTGRIAAFALAGLVAAGGLLWLVTSGPGFLGYGSSLLWAGSPRQGDQPLYEIRVSPGNQVVRRGGDQLITAHLFGFQSDAVRLFAKYASSSKWEELPMLPEPGGVGFEFLFASVPEPVEYYVQGGPVRSEHYRLDVLDLPSVKRIQVTYHFPKWLERASLVEENGGDLRAVEGTEAELVVETDRPLENGRLVLDDGTETVLTKDGETTARGRITIERDGIYHVAVMERGERVRISEDYFIEAQPERPPEIRVSRPGRDYRASPIEEVTVAVTAADDFGMNEVSLRYSVNGGPEKSVSLLPKRGAEQASGETTIYLEEHGLAPGDLVSFYAQARDARTSARTDMFFIEVQPFERNFTQSQQSGGGMMGGQQEDNRISPRQKEIISATWNLLRDENRTREQLAEEGKFLSEVQGTLQQQATSLAERMKARQIAFAGEQFKSFTDNMEAAAREMGEAVDRLKGLRWRDALEPEQRALQHLMRAEAVFRDIQVAQGGQGGGGGGGMGRDLENLFDLELDTEKNQYETGQRAAADASRSQEIDEALQRLQQLAQRQQELARRQQQNQQSFQQRWEQEMLRREAEELQREMERLLQESLSQRQASSRMQRGQSSSQQSGQAGQRSQQSGQTGSAGDQRLEQALERLRQATEDMRDAASSQAQAQARNNAQSRRAAERLQEATKMLSGLRQEQSTGQLGDIAERARDLASRQQEVADRLRELYQNHQAITGRTDQPEPAAPDPADVMRLAEEKQEMTEQLQQLERDMQQAVRDLAGTQREASAKLREALGEMQQGEIGLRMKYLSEWIRRGLGAYAWLREAPVTEGLNRLAEQTREAEQALGQGSRQQEGVEQALSRVEQLRAQLQAMEQSLRQSQSAQARGQGGQQRSSEPGQPGQRGGEQQGQQGGQARGQQPGGHGSPSQMGPRGYGGSGDAGSAMNTGERRLPETGIRPPATDRRSVERAYEAAIRDLSDLRRGVRDNREVAGDIADLVQQMRQLDPSRFPGNPELVEQLRTQVLTGLEQIELRLRRELEGDAEALARTEASQAAPAGYADAVADYFRRLSEGSGAK